MVTLDRPDWQVLHVWRRHGSGAGVPPARAKSPPMTEHVASRTLVKSPPELWAECSDAASLARHLDQFGEIRITRLDPETAVAWEGERARGTVRIEPAGWGTKVILTAVGVAGKAPPEVGEAPADEPEAPAQAPEAGEPPADALEVVEAEMVEPEAEGRAVAEAEVEPDPPAAVAEDEAPEPAEAHLPPEPDEAATDPPARRRRFARLFGFLRGPEPAAIEPEARAPDETVVAEPSAPAEPAPARVHAAAPPAERTARPHAPRATPEPPAAAPDPQATAPEPPAAPGPPVTEAALTAALDSLGQAHHRPYSRA